MNVEPHRRGNRNLAPEHNALEHVLAAGSERPRLCLNMPSFQRKRSVRSCIFCVNAGFRRARVVPGYRLSLFANLRIPCDTMAKKWSPATRQRPPKANGSRTRVGIRDFLTGPIPHAAAKLRKVDSSPRRLGTFDVWFTAFAAREQSPTRKNPHKKTGASPSPPPAKLFEGEASLADWNWAQVWNYTSANGNQPPSSNKTKAI